MSGSSDLPYLTQDMSDRPTKTNMTRVRAILYMSDQRAVYVLDKGAWAFALGNDTEALHHFGPIYQVLGTAEKFAFTGELENFTTGEKYEGPVDPHEVAAWIASTTPKD